MPLAPMASAFLMALQSAAGTAAEPMVIYGFAILDDGDSAFIRLEIEAPPDAPAIRLAPFGTRPVPFALVDITRDTSALRWVWPDRLYAHCSLSRLAGYHWEGSCRSGDEERRIRLGGGYVPDLGQDLPVLPIDLAILDRALALLSSPAAWNRQDDRLCEDDASTRRWSLFCALFAASMDRAGRYLHDRPAMNAPREVIVLRASDRIHRHTLRDFNNHPGTTFGEIRNVLEAARARLAGGDP